MELELYPWKFCRARPSQVSCRAEAEQGTLTLRCREAPVRLQWDQQSRSRSSEQERALRCCPALLGSRLELRQGCVCTAGRAVPTGVWDVLTILVTWDSVAPSLSLARICSVCQARAGQGMESVQGVTYWPDSGQAKRERSEPRKGNAEGGVFRVTLLGTQPPAGASLL